jgi:hypothetical protein
MDLPGFFVWTEKTTARGQSFLTRLAVSFHVCWAKGMTGETAGKMGVAALAGPRPALSKKHPCYPNGESSHGRAPRTRRSGVELFPFLTRPWPRRVARVLSSQIFVCPSPSDYAALLYTTPPAPSSDPVEPSHP